MRITQITPHVVNLSAKSNWFFIRVECDDGSAGIGEATLYGREPLQLVYLEKVSAEWVGLSPDEAKTRLAPGVSTDLVESSVTSALEQALTDAAARAKGVPLHATLGAAQRSSVRMYANINRRTEDRTPEGFAASAREAIAQGYTAVKIAPFDGLVPEEAGTNEGRARTGEGVERIYAVREAIGPRAELLVDCHWRFDEGAAARVLREIEAARLFWFECPIAETRENHRALVRLRGLAHNYGTRLAGAEQEIGLEGLRPFVEGGALDVVMPDVKYAGGYGEMLRIAQMCERSGVAFSPHNPTGPVCTMASLHVCAVAPAFLILEHQVGESPLYYEILRGGHPKVADGAFDVPNGPGLGIELDDEVMKAHPYRALTNVRDSRLGK